MTKYLSFFALLIFFALPQSAYATAYYIDFGLTTAGGVGTATTTAFANLQQFTDVARSAGDIAFVRRGAASTTNVTAISVTSDGTMNNPIIVTADYDNLWSDFATSSQTYTPVFGELTMTASGSITGIAAGDWIYVAGDCQDRYGNKAAVPTSPTLNPCEFAYEVKTVSGTTLTLHLPYKGNQSGAGLELRVMPDAPRIGITTTAAQIIAMSQDGSWYFKGLEGRSTNSSCVVTPGAGSETKFFDMVLQTDGTSACGYGGATGIQKLDKIRSFGGLFTSVGAPAAWTISDFLIDCNNVANSRAFNFNSMAAGINAADGTVQNCSQTFAFSAAANNSSSGGVFLFKNVKNNYLFNSLSGGAPGTINFEDNFSTVGLNSSVDQKISANTLATTTMSTTTNLRSGGGPVNLFVSPPAGTGNTGISTRFFPYSYIKLFEYPIYTDTTSRTYTMYFNATSTTAWTVNPLTATAAGSSTPELYIECEYYNDSSDADRYLKRSNSASDVDFDGSTAWQDISVTCQPTQNGILYLRGWYAKPKETGASNMFYMDTTPEIN